MSALNPFDFLTAGRIRFGRGQAETAVEEIIRRGHRVLLVRGRSVAWADELSANLEDKGVTLESVFCTAEPDLAMLEAARKTTQQAQSDVVVAVGGGAVIDLAKAIAALAPSNSAALDHLEGVGQGQPLTADPLPFIALPSTAGTGAEVTKNAVISVPDAGRKVSLRDDRMLPNLAIIDPALTDNAPRSVTLSSGLDAVTQVIEPYLCNRSNPLVDAIARAAIPVGLSALAQLEQGESAAARDQMAYVSLVGGMALANAGLGAVHGLAGVVGGRLGAPHGLICGRLLGPVLAANHEALLQQGQSVERFDEVAHWLSTHLDIGTDNPFEALSALLDQWQVDRLGKWLADDVNLHTLAEEAAGASSMRANPCVLSTDALVGIMRAAA